MSDDPRLDLRIAAGIARLTIRRPDKLNALDAEMVDALLPICRLIERSDARVLILTGEGGGRFARVATSPPGRSCRLTISAAAGCATAMPHSMRSRGWCSRSSRC